MAERANAGKLDLAEPTNADLETCEGCGRPIRETDAHAVQVPIFGGWADVCGACNAEGVTLATGESVCLLAVRS